MMSAAHALHRAAVSLGVANTIAHKASTTSTPASGTGQPGPRLAGVSRTGGVSAVGVPHR